MHREIALVVLLQIGLVFSACLDGWTEYINSGGQCIKAFTDQKSFIDALEYCQKIGDQGSGSLVSIHNIFQNAQVASVGQSANENCLYWIGLFDFDDSVGYGWTDSSTFDYKFWDAGYPPAVTEGTTAYMAVSTNKRWRTTAEFSDTNCYVCIQGASSGPQTTKQPTTKITQQPTVGPGTTIGPGTTPSKQTTAAGGTTTLSGNCNPGWTQYGNACYFWSDDQVVESDAEDKCVSNGGHLVSILSAEEQAFLGQHIPQQWYFWIGLVRDADTWTWTDGSSVGYKNWIPGCPWDNEDELCSVADYTSDGTWFNVNCDRHYLYICKQQLAANKRRPL